MPLKEEHPVLAGGAATGFVAGDWAHPSTIGYDADDDAPEGD